MINLVEPRGFTLLNALSHLLNMIWVHVDRVCFHFIRTGKETEFFEIARDFLCNIFQQILINASINLFHPIFHFDLKVFVCSNFSLVQHTGLVYLSAYS